MTAPARRGKIQALDGLRAVAIVIVILLFRTHSPLWVLAAVGLPATLAAAEALTPEVAV